MKASDAVVQLLRDLHADSFGYKLLRDLLEQQFQGALKHQAEVLLRVGGEIETLCGQMEQRRAKRMELVSGLLKDHPRPSMKRLIEALPGAAAQTLAGLWAEVEQLLHVCKELNQRNCRLIMDQQELMQRLLGEDGGVYADR
ncbi:MAG TPA: flagellar protein FlgN [Roseateles sp.]